MKVIDRLQVLEKLIELQGTKTGEDFAEQLGIHRVSWQRIKKGRVPISDKFLMRVHQSFPELNIFLTERVTNHNANDTDALQKPPNRKLSLMEWLREGIFGRRK